MDKVWRGSEYIKLVENIFDDQGRLKVYSEHEWDDRWLTLESSLPELTDDDVPF